MSSVQVIQHFSRNNDLEVIDTKDIPKDSNEDETIISERLLSKIENRENRVPDRRRSVFKEDKEIPEIFRAKITDFVGTGFDRMLFYLSNFYL